MGKNKYYAVRVGKVPGIYESWEECKKMIDGYSNAEYKSFGKKEDAIAYINNKDIGEKHKQTAAELETAIAYVDGSFSTESNRYSFGSVIITPNGDVIKKSGYGDDPNALTIRNIAGELQGAMYVIKYVHEAGYKKLVIRHDYIGISKWYSGEWKAKDAIVKKFVDFVSRYRNDLDIYFEKVEAHTGDKFNEEADRLAKGALHNGEKIKKDEYGLIAEEIKPDDLNSIFEILKDDIKGLVVEPKIEAYSETYRLISPSKEKIVIKYYKDKNYKIHVQGKPTELFSLFSTYVTELVEVEQIPIILNECYKVDIQKENVEAQFKVYLGKAYGNLPTKIERVLHQAVYNLNLDGDMYDSTFLTFPSYRALEGFLKFILEKYRVNCENCFDMFERSRRGNGAYKLKKVYEPKIGSPKKIDYFNKCYNYFYNNRHVLFHWDNMNESQDTTTLIGSTEQAKRHIKDTLELIEEFFNIV